VTHHEAQQHPHRPIKPARAHTYIHTTNTDRHTQHQAQPQQGRTGYRTRDGTETTNNLAPTTPAPQPPSLVTTRQRVVNETACRCSRPLFNTQTTSPPTPTSPHQGDQPAKEAPSHTTISGVMSQSSTVCPDPVPSPSAPPGSTPPHPTSTRRQTQSQWLY